MSVQWTYIPNEEQEQVFCPHCSDWRDTGYFTSGEDVVCLRCAKVLSQAYKIAIEREAW